MTDTATAYEVYVHERGKRPRKVSVTSGKIASTITVEGRTYYWVGADLSQRTLTYTDTKPASSQ